MNTEEAKTAVAIDGTRVIARYADGSVRAEGEAYSYSMVPVLYIVTDEGERISWRHDMCELAPTAAEQVVARFDSFSPEEHAAGIKAARERAGAKKAARHARAASAADRLRENCEHRMTHVPGSDPWANRCDHCGFTVTFAGWCPVPNEVPIDHSLLVSGCDACGWTPQEPPSAKTPRANAG